MFIMYNMEENNKLGKERAFISIKENDKPELPICKMNCDSDLAEHLNDYDLTKLAFSQYSTNLLIGKPRSGKTSLLY